jgi:hypothetical protein
MADSEGRSSATRKLTPMDRRQLQRDLAAGELTRAQIARRFGVGTSYISKFARQYAWEIDQIKAALTDRFAGLWIASQESRIVAYQEEYALAMGSDKHDHHEWIKARTAILHTVAEELGQLPPRATVVVQPVTHVIVGVDMDDLR